MKCFELLRYFRPKFWKFRLFINYSCIFWQKFLGEDFHIRCQVHILKQIFTIFFTNSNNHKVLINDVSCVENFYETMVMLICEANNNVPIASDITFMNKNRTKKKKTLSSYFSLKSLRKKPKQHLTVNFWPIPNNSFIFMSSIYKKIFINTYVVFLLQIYTQFILHNILFTARLHRYRNEENDYICIVSFSPILHLSIIIICLLMSHWGYTFCDI